RALGVFDGGEDRTQAVGIGERVDAGRRRTEGLLVAGQEFLGFGIGQVFGSGHVDEDGTLGSVAGDLGKGRVLVGVAADEVRFHAELLHLGADQAAIGVVTGEEQHVGIFGLQLGQDGAVVLGAGIDEVFGHDVAVVLLQGIDSRLGQAGGVAGAVAQHGDALVLLHLGEVVGHEFGFVAVGRRVAEEGLPAALGQLVAGAVRGLDDVGGGIDRGGGQCGAAGVGADHGDHAVVDQLAAADGGLRSLAFIVAHDHL